MKTPKPTFDQDEFFAIPLAERYAKPLAEFNAAVEPDKTRRNTLHTRSAAVESRINEILAKLPSLGGGGVGQAELDGEAMFRGAAVGESPEVKVANLRDDLKQLYRERRGLVPACALADQAVDATTSKASKTFCKAVRADHERSVQFVASCTVALSRANRAERSLVLGVESLGVSISSMPLMSFPDVGVGRLNDHESGVRRYLREASDGGFDVDRSAEEQPAMSDECRARQRAAAR